jgi:lipopolysaccharide transport system ATP-binding protein
MSAISIEISGLSKCYTLNPQRRGYGTLRESIVENAYRSLRRVTTGRRQSSGLATFWALRDVSFSVGQGEAVGLIGHNGAGKTTLLKILCRITEPTAGWLELTGRVGSLLEVGTGFHPELTGRENVYLYGSILGMRRPEIRRRFDEIVTFAEIERFLDIPVKRYSSGMSVRLAFAVAAHLEPEILLVDEVLAVGDAAFQRKSLGKMGEIVGEGRTVIFVSHNLAIIQALCRRAVLLREGEVVADGAVGDAIDQYLRALESAASNNLLERADRYKPAWRQVLVSGVEIQDASGTHPNVVVGGRQASITVHLTTMLPKMECRLTIVNSLGQPITTLDSELSSPRDLRDPSRGPRIVCDLSSVPLVPGRYRIDVLLKARNQIQDGLVAATFFDVEPGVVDGRPMPTASSDGDVVLDHTWQLPA